MYRPAECTHRTGHFQLQKRSALAMGRQRQRLTPFVIDQASGPGKDDDREPDEEDGSESEMSGGERQ